MDIQTMKHIDRFAGYPLCGLLKLHELAARARPGLAAAAGEWEESAESAGDLGKIGVIKFWGMGSLILAAPMFKALRQLYPRAEIHFITMKPNQGILRFLDLADQAHYLDLSGSPSAIGLNIFDLFRRMAGLGLSAVIDLEYLTRFSAVASYLSRAPVRVGFHSWDVWRGGLHTVRRAFNPYWHVTDNFLNLAAGLGGKELTAAPGVELRLDGSEEEEAETLLARADVAKGERVIAVNPNASTMALARRWPEASFVELVDRLTAAGLGRVVLLGSPEEAARVARVQDRTRDPKLIVNLAGRSSLAGLVGVLKRAQVLITNDSGPLHLADVLGTSTVSFFGPETPVLYGPRGSSHQVLYRGIDCSPCINVYNAKTVRCMRPEPECLSGIGVDEAFRAARRALGEER